MRQIIPIIILIAISGCAVAAAATAKEECPPQSGVALQVLGSGGPIADDARASSGYIIWLDGKSRLLIDAGGGTFLRFGEANASFRDLEFIGLSHFMARSLSSLDANVAIVTGAFDGTTVLANDLTCLVVD